MRTGGALILALPLAMCCPLQTQQPEQDGYGLASAEAQTVICADAAMAEKVRAIMFSSLDRALEEHVVHMFSVWMKDARDQPARAATGIKAGIIAYIHASKQTALWNPMVCPG